MSELANMPHLFMVIYDDEQGLTCPMGADPDCEGALCGLGHRGKVKLFTSRKAARTAIDISAKYAALLRSQGKPENTDFLEARKFIRVVECEISKS